MNIRKLDTRDSRDINIFIEFPKSLYKGNGLWVPPLDSEVRMTLDKQAHPFYEHSDAEFFVAEAGDKVLGRIAVLNNRNYCSYKNTETGFFYYFDCVDNQDVANHLFDQAISWARARNLKSIIGPKGFLRSSGMGLLVDGFQFPPALAISYNFPYYRTLIENFGFQKELDQFSGFMTTDQSLPTRLYEIADRVIEKKKYWIKTFKNIKEIKQLIPLVKHVQDAAFLDNPNYFPSTDKEFNLIAQSMIQISKPGMIKLIMHEDDVAGFVISYPDISNALRKINGKLFPFGWIQVLMEKNNTEIVNFNGVGILPKFQGLGANVLLYVELEKTIRSSDYKFAEFVQVNEDNFKSRSDWETLGVSITKTHRTYRLYF